MAIRIGVRIKPEPGRSALETTIQDPGEENGMATGGMVRVLQLVGWDDTKLPLANYTPGLPETERHLIIIDQHVATLSVAAFVGATFAETHAMWEAAFADKIAYWTTHRDQLAAGAAGAAMVASRLI